MHTTQSGSAIFGRIDELHLSRSERLRINAYMHDGELIAEFCCRALANIQSGAGALSRAVRAMFASPAR